MSKMIATTAYLTPEQMAALKRIAELTHTPFSTFIREGIDMRVEAEHEGLRNGTVLVRP